MSDAQDGDRRAYDVLLSEVSGLVRRYGGRKLPNPEWVDDLVQETLISIHQARHTFDPGRSFLSWMYSIAHHRLIDIVRMQRRKQKNEIVNDLENLNVAANVSTQPFTFLYEALTRLSANQRKIIQLLKFDGFTVEEISLQMGLSESAVKVTAHRGYKKLRQLLGELSNGN